MRNLDETTITQAVIAHHANTSNERLQRVPGLGHWLHIEAGADISWQMLAWFAEGRTN